MIAIIARKELLALYRDRRVLILGLGLLAVWAMLYAAALGQQQRQQAERAEIGETTRAQWDKQGIKHPHRGAHFGMYAFRPHAPLSAFDPGIEPYVGQALWLEPHRRNMARFNPAADGGPGARFGHIAPAFLLAGLFPLLIMALAFSQATQERELGTLRMLQSMGVSNRALLAGKLLAITGCLTAVFLPVFALLALGAIGELAPAGLLPRIAGLAAVYLLYYLITAALGLAVGAFSAGSRGALFVLAVVWAVFVLAAPRAASAIAQGSVPLPSGSQFWAAIAHDYKHGLPGDPDLATQVRDFEAGLLRRYGVASLSQVPIGVNAARRLLRDAYADKVHAHHFDALWARYMRQQRLLRWAGVFSPTIPLAATSAALSGTSLAHQRHFEEAAEQYRQAFNASIDEWDMAHTHGQVSYETEYAADSVWQSVRPFQYSPPSLGFSLRTAGPDLMLLAGWAVAAIGLLGAAARRWQP
ncbi:DUF3526 domain-containing protein [Achromobacter sp. NPDC058515]|uniref:DUF3526 domain-containing protein n=1 Tax=Achromobacter sp. NPDC058515 TaxID=3346533 RepID=UPI003656E50C